MKTRYLIAASLAVASILALVSEWRGRTDFEEEVVRAVLTQDIRSEASRCPLGERAIGQAPSWLLAACAVGGVGWIEAAERYGGDAANVFLVYGADEEFAAVFDRLGHQTVPVVAYFTRHGSTQYLVEETIGQGVSRLWREGRLGFGLAELSPEQYGLIAVSELNRRGHEMLSEFEIVDGVAVRKPLTRALLGAKNLVLGGVSDLEAVVARGERLPSWSEVGWAALDAVIVVGGVGAVAKTLRAARVPTAVAARGTARMAYLRTAGRGAAQSLAAVGRAAGVAAAVALPYVAITRPHLVAGAAGWLAEQAGLPAWTGVFTAYALLCLTLAVLGKILLGPVVGIVRVFGRMVRALGRIVLPRPAHAGSMAPARMRSG